MKNGNEYLVNNLIFTFQIYLAVLVIAVCTTLSLKFFGEYSEPKKSIRQHAFVSAISSSDGLYSVLREKKENLSYVSSVIFGSIIIFLSLFFLHKYLAPRLQKISEKYLRWLVVIASLPSLFFIHEVADEFNCQTLLFPQNIEQCYVPLVMFLTLAIFNLIIFRGASSSSRFERWIKIIYIFAAVFVAILIGSFLVFDDYLSSPEGYSINFNPIAYPIIQQYFGNELLINFKSLYGLHPYFLQLFLHIFPAKVLTISSTLAALQVIALLSLSFVIFKTVKNRLLALCGFLALIFLHDFSVDGRFVPDGVTFQYEPIRLLFPALLLAFFCFFYQNPTTKRYYFGLTFFSLATLWNLDSGIPTFLSLVLILGYEKLKENFSWKVLAIHLAKSFAILAAIWLALFAFLRIKYGQWPVLPWIFYGQSSALDFGYAMLPIAPKGAWRIVVLIYILGLVFAINNFLTKKHSLQNSAIFLLTALGIGLFTYFMGRSHVSNIMHCGYPAAILLIIFADKFCCQLVERKFCWSGNLLRLDIVVLMLPLLAVSYFSAALIFKMRYNSEIKSNFISNRFAHNSQPYWISELNFIKENIATTQAPVRDDILMLNLTDQDYLFDLEIKAKSPLKVINIRHAFYQEEMDEIFTAVKSAQKKWSVLILPKNKNDYPILSDEEIEKLQTILRQHYKIKAQMAISKEGGVTIFERSGDEKK